MTATFETLTQLDAELAAAGHHPLTPFWRPALERFYAHPTACTLVGRVGRGGAKSHTSAKVALNETLFGDWHIPPGERHYWAFVSVNKDEAAQRLLLLENFLRALHIKFETKGDAINLLEAPRGFRVFACQIGAVSGFRCFGYSEDELSKYNVDGVNPAEELSGSLSAMCVTHPGARKLLISSPLGLLDYHAQRFERGETDDQIIASAPSWVANPDGITEESTHRAEPNARIWSREYFAVPSSMAGAAMDPAAVDGAFAHARVGSSHQRVLIVDPSSGRKDTWSWAVVSWVEPAVTHPPVLENRRRIQRGSVMINGVPHQCDNLVDDLYVQDRTGTWIPYLPAKADPFLMVHEIDGVEGAFFDQVPADAIVSRHGGICRRNGIQVVHSDQREEYALASLYSRAGLRFIPHAYSSTSKADGMAHLRRWFSEGKLALPHHEKLRAELLSFEEKILPSGAIGFGARGSGHDDYVALLLTAAIADLDRGLPGSPTRSANIRHEVSGR